MSAVPLLAVRHLRVEFPSRRGTLVAIDDVSLTIAPGEVLGVVRFALKPYAGQLEAATLARVLPILKDMEMKIGASRDLIE